MSCKKYSSFSRNKHYTPIEKQLFLQILHLFKHIIEIKKNDSTTIKDKEVAWQEICSKYNESSLISQERTVQQLKKLWTNLKQVQRDAITKEKQSRMLTGEGPQQVETSIDPDVANIAPHLMKTAPILFSSNMKDTEIDDQRDIIFKCISTGENVELLNDEEDIINIENDTGASQNTSIVIEECKKSTTLHNTDFQKFYPSTEDKNITPHMIKRKKTERITKLSNLDEDIRVERIREIMKQEKYLASIQAKHEERMIDIKEEHLKEFNFLQIKHLKEIHEAEMEIKKAKLKAVKYQFQQKENIDPCDE